MHALRTDLADGYIARYENGTFRVVADGFRFTNEIRFDANEEFMYVVETTGGRITRLRIDERGNLRDREVFGPSTLGKGAWPDGIAFDAYGNLWGTMVYSDKLFVLTPEGDLRVLLDEGDPVKVDALEQAFVNNSVTEDVLFATGQGVAPWMASVTFGGPDLRTVYIGSLKGRRIPLERTAGDGVRQTGRDRQAHGLPDLLEHAVTRRLHDRMMEVVVRVRFGAVIVAHRGFAHLTEQHFELIEGRLVDTDRGRAGGHTLERRPDWVDLEQLLGRELAHLSPAEG
jgi:hypothetical protein